LENGWNSPLWKFLAFFGIGPTIAISRNYAQSESLGIRLGGYKKNIRSKSSLFPELNLTSVPRSGRAE
jgi:hypothetical protein